MGQDSLEQHWRRGICEGTTGERDNSLNLLLPWRPAMAVLRNRLKERAGSLWEGGTSQLAVWDKITRKEIYVPDLPATTGATRLKIPSIDLRIMDPVVFFLIP